MSKTASALDAPLPIEFPNISQTIWEEKYRFKGNPHASGAADPDADRSATARRIARSLASAARNPRKRKALENRFAKHIEGLYMLPGGRIMAGTGTERSVTLFNCFVMGTISDSLDSIFAHLREAALTMQMGGGIGYDFSTLRPRGTTVRGVQADASGPISFMDVWDAMCKTILSAGGRRGAMMGVLRCDHPDIEEFIEVKRDPSRLRKFNLSVLVTDPFMKAVRDDADFDLVFNGVVHKTVRARDLWNRIMRATYDVAEPGVIFIDRINAANNLWYCEKISATNPCVTGDTLVLTATGSKRIDAMLSEAQTIVGGDGALHRIRPAYLTGVKPVVTLTTRDGRSLRLTGDHLVMTESGDRAARHLKAGDRIRVVAADVVAHEANGGAVPVPMAFDEVASVTEGGVEPVFDLTEPATQHFIANGIVVHNCGEQPLPPYGTCLLGSVNLARLVIDPFTPQACLDMEALDIVVTDGVRMLDSVIDVSRYPQVEQEKEAKAKRRIGLGITGLADALLMCGLRYGSPEAQSATETWLSALRRHAYMASAMLAKELGAFPLFDAEKYLAGETVRSLDEDVRDAIAAYGMRNSHVLSIAPAGTISLYAGNVSSGLEPIFAPEYTRKRVLDDGSTTDERVEDYAVAVWRALKGDDSLPPNLVTAMDLAPADHIAMQGVVQRYVDSSISKTINVPADIDFEAFKDIYIQAYDAGCKGCTTYRPNEVTGAVLSVDAPATQPAAEREPLPLDAVHADLHGHSILLRGTGLERLHRDGDGWRVEPLAGDELVPLSQDCVADCKAGEVDPKPPRPERLLGSTYKLVWPESDHALYVTVNDIEDDYGRRRPFEVFLNSKNTEHYAWIVALTRMISAVFRRGGDVGFVVEELKAVFDPRGGAWVKGSYIPSIVAAIGGVIERHMIETGFLPQPEKVVPGDKGAAIAYAPSEAQSTDAGTGATPLGRSCPKCSQPSLVMGGGCETCMSCGYSRCSG